MLTEFKGALTENFVLQSLLRKFEVEPLYWAEAPYEVDFIIQKENDIFPFEVKAGINVSASNIKQYLKQYEKATKVVIRFSLKNLSRDGKILNVPLYLIDEIDRLIDIAYKQLKQ